jgi:hypothetical protein
MIADQPATIRSHSSYQGFSRPSHSQHALISVSARMHVCRHACVREGSTINSITQCSNIHCFRLHLSISKRITSQLHAHLLHHHPRSVQYLLNLFLGHGLTLLMSCSRLSFCWVYPWTTSRTTARNNEEFNKLTLESSRGANKVALHSCLSCVCSCGYRWFTVSKFEYATKTRDL